MRRMASIVILLLVIPLLGNGTSSVLDELVRPTIILTHSDRIYVLERASIYIYSLKDFKLIKKFGQEGEGPREFITRPFGPPMSMAFFKGELAVNSLNKISYFNADGEFIRETKSLANLVMYPFGSGYLAVGPAVDEQGRGVIAFRLFDLHLKETEILHQTELDVSIAEQLVLPLGPFTYQPMYGDKLYLAPSNDEFIIDVYNSRGEKASRIKKKFDKIKISEKYKKEAYDWFKIDPVFKAFFERVKSILKFRGYFPPIRDIHLADDNIYVITFKTKNGLWECITMDLSGNEKNRTYVPLSEYVPFTYYPLLYSIYQGKMYSLVDDTDDEGWKIHVTDLK